MKSLHPLTVLLYYPQLPQANQLQVLTDFLEHSRGLHRLLHGNEHKRLHYLQANDQIDVLQLLLGLLPVPDSPVEVERRLDALEDVGPRRPDEVLIVSRRVHGGVVWLLGAAPCIVLQQSLDWPDACRY